MKKGKVAGSTLVSKIVKSEGVAGTNVTTGQISQFTLRVIQVEGELSSNGNCYMGKRDALEKGNYRGLSLTDQTLKIVERLIQRLMRQQVNITAAV